MAARGRGKPRPYKVVLELPMASSGGQMLTIMII